MQSVALTYSWNRMAYIVNKSLSARGIKVYAGDTSYLTMNRFSRFGYNQFRYPNFYHQPDAFIEYLTVYLQKHSINNLIPTHEEIFLISRHIDRFQGINTLVPYFDILKTAHKKELSVRLAKTLNVNIPLSIEPTSSEECFYFFNQQGKPIVLKYSNSNSSKGVYYINTIKELEFHLPNIGSFILQEYINGSGYGVSMLYNRGQKRAIFTHKRLEEKVSTGGTSTLRISTRNEMLEEWAERLLSHLSWNGVAMVEFKYNEQTRKGWFIEINPRFWGSLALPYYAGMDFPWLYYQILRDGDINFTNDYKEGVRVKWLLGGMIAFADNLFNDKKINLNHLKLNANYYDDFSWGDPMALLGEMAYYGEKFMKSFKLNPTKDSSLNIDDI